MPRPAPSTMPPTSGSVTARFVDGPGTDNNDWRVSLSVPTTIQDSAALTPLIETNNRMIFPFNPSIVMSQRANYTEIGPTHSNYVFYAYQNSQIDDITIAGDFLIENASDARYWLATIHFFRTMTKMFYGESTPLGNPPLICRLNGYGEYVLNNIPVVIKNFSVDLQADVDYIPCDFNGSINYVPTQSTVTTVVSPNYSRRSTSQFSLNKFANGDYVGNGSEGFI